MIYSKIEVEFEDMAKIESGLAAILPIVGTDAFAAGFARLIHDGFGITEYFAFERTCGTAAPQALLSGSIDGMSAERSGAYCARFFRDDPIYDVLNGETPDGSYILRVLASDIRNPVFRHQCYTRAGFIEKLTLASMASGQILALSVFIRAAAGETGPLRQAQFNRFGNLLLSILTLHTRLVAGNARQKQPSAREMEECVAAMFPQLTGREVAVCARSILGVTAEGIALDLGIKQTSVLTYRRRAYTRLNINSINQLSTFLIRSAPARQLSAA